ncbi:MAG TPA: glucosamine-6-phosphate deaminase [Bacteroidota bacterium]|nr:glucosamine-6-phosphate deaminase [Bacteroidota bacterium]
MNASANPVTTLRIDRLHVGIYPDRESLGRAAAAEVGEMLKALLARQSSVRMVFAAAPSQNEFLTSLSRCDGVAWNKVTALHMDEYLGLEGDAPQLFANFLRERIFRRVPFGRVHYINPHLDRAVEECRRYSALLREAPVDIVCLGIGENGHIAFNEPHVADFKDPSLVKLVDLDSQSRDQQVHDKCFARLEDVPRKAVTLTIPALLSGRSLFIIVPGKAKAEAVHRALCGEIEESCPASILRTHANARLFLDTDSASKYLATRR